MPKGRDVTGVLQWHTRRLFLKVMAGPMLGRRNRFFVLFFSLVLMCVRYAFPATRTHFAIVFLARVAIRDFAYAT